MTLVLIVIVLATVGALLLGRRPHRRLATPLRRRRLLVTATGFALAGYLVSYAWTPALVVGLASAGVLVAHFAWLNARTPGLPLVGTGVLLNSLVMVANGAMPVSLDAARRAGSDLDAADLLASPWREAVTDATILPFLGDVLPLAWPVAPQVVSVGDVLVAAGCGLFVLRGLSSVRPALDAHGRSAGTAHQPTALGDEAEPPADHGMMATPGTASGTPAARPALEGAISHGQEGP